MCPGGLCSGHNPGPIFLEARLAVWSHCMPYPLFQLVQLHIMQDWKKKKNHLAVKTWDNCFYLYVCICHHNLPEGPCVG